MPKVISELENKSLEELEWEFGELVAFDDNDSELCSPMLLANPKKIVRGHHDGGVRLTYHHVTENMDEPVETFTLYASNVIGLWSPGIGKIHKSPNFFIVSPKTNPYYIGKAVAGAEAIKEYLGTLKSDGMDYYQKFLKPDREPKVLELILRMFLDK